MLSDNIKELRKENNWTQEELATKMGYKSKSTINKIEMGINDIPQSKIAKFAEVLGTTPAQLMGWEEQEEKNLSPSEENLTEGEKILLELFSTFSHMYFKCFGEEQRFKLLEEEITSNKKIDIIILGTNIFINKSDMKFQTN